MDIRNTLIKSFKKVGVRKGDILYVASDSTRILYKALEALKESGKTKEEIKNNAMNAVLEALMESVGEGGTLLIPTFNFEFCGGGVFDYNATKSAVGILGDAARKRSGFKRTFHPIYSFAVWGKDRDHLVSLKNTDAWGGDSPFAFLLHRYEKAKFLSIGINNEGEGFSFVHFVEQALLTEHRYHKKFTGYYINENGDKSLRTYSMFVRDLKRNVKTVCSENFLRKRDIIKKHEDVFTVKLVGIPEAYDAFWKELNLNGGKDLIVEIPSAKDCPNGEEMYKIVSDLFPEACSLSGGGIAKLSAI